ncbi:hypothetical protein HDV05_008733 [Chytridiales sp. JEL 0842]|nr:hypothetical protein HDV05_008733 [Chytridiales sp. JEL 0842]
MSERSSHFSSVAMMPAAFSSPSLASASAAADSRKSHSENNAFLDTLTAEDLVKDFKRRGMFDAIRKQLIEDFQNSPSKQKFAQDALNLMSQTQSRVADETSRTTVTHRVLSHLVEKYETLFPKVQEEILSSAFLGSKESSQKIEAGLKEILDKLRTDATAPAKSTNATTATSTTKPASESAKDKPASQLSTEKLASEPAQDKVPSDPAKAKAVSTERKEKESSTKQPHDEVLAIVGRNDSNDDMDISSGDEDAARTANKFDVSNSTQQETSMATNSNKISESDKKDNDDVMKDVRKSASEKEKAVVEDGSRVAVEKKLKDDDAMDIDDGPKDSKSTLISLSSAAADVDKMMETKTDSMETGDKSAVVSIISANVDKKSQAIAEYTEIDDSAAILTTSANVDENFETDADSVPLEAKSTIISTTSANADMKIETTTEPMETEINPASISASANVAKKSEAIADSLETKAKSSSSSTTSANVAKNAEVAESRKTEVAKEDTQEKINKGDALAAKTNTDKSEPPITSSKRQSSSNDKPDDPEDPMPMGQVVAAFVQSKDEETGEMKDACYQVKVQSYNIAEELYTVEDDDPEARESRMTWQVTAENIVDFKSPLANQGLKVGDKVYALFQGEEYEEPLTEFYKAVVVKINKGSVHVKYEDDDEDPKLRLDRLFKVDEWRTQSENTADLKVDEQKSPVKKRRGRPPKIRVNEEKDAKVAAPPLAAEQKESSDLSDEKAATSSKPTPRLSRRSLPNTPIETTLSESKPKTPLSATVETKSRRSSTRLTADSNPTTPPSVVEEPKKKTTAKETKKRRERKADSKKEQGKKDEGVSKFFDDSDLSDLGSVSDSSSEDE